jgi:hypothetical protein
MKKSICVFCVCLLRPCHTVRLEYLVLKGLICMKYPVQVKRIGSAVHKYILYWLVFITVHAPAGILYNKQQTCYLLQAKAVSQLFVSIY